MKKGFTLVELAIVLVIIGLLVGGVLAGQELIHNATLNGDITEVKNFDLSAQTFRLKYNCLPGDCNKASSFLTGANNGNGDGEIDSVDPDTNYIATDGGFETWEIAFAIDDLARANLIKIAPFDVLLAADISNFIPKLKSGGGFILRAECSFDSTANLCFFTGHQTYRLGGENGHDDDGDSNGSIATDSPVYTPEDAVFIDTKIDDGKPISGIVKLGFNAPRGEPAAFLAVTPDTGDPILNGQSCILNYPTNQYNLSVKDKICGIFIRSEL